jgi:hypothetical protein
MIITYATQLLRVIVFLEFRKKYDKMNCNFTKGLKSYVSWDSGTDFGRALARNLVKYAYEKDINSIISRVLMRYL